MRWPTVARMRMRGRAVARMLVRGRAVARPVAAVLSGAVVALALPPVDFVPAILGYTPFLLLLDAADGARRPVLARAVLGAAFGFGYHLAGLWWVGAAFLVDADTFGALLPLAVVGLPLLLAPLHALAAVAMGLAPPSPAWRVVGLAVALAATEWLRGVVLTGFPWNAAGLQLTGSSVALQGAAVVGLNGLSFVAVLLGASPVALIARGSRWLALPVVAVVVALAAYGSARLARAPSIDATQPRVRVVQPSVPQAHKWDPAESAAIWRRLLDLTASPTGDGAAVDVVIWPETAFPFIYRTPSVEQLDLAAALGGGAMLLAGAVELEATADGRRATNSLILVGSDGAPLARYDKNHLVPFGEYLPLKGVLSAIGLRQITEAVAAFDAGTDRQPIDIPGLAPALPLICYEVIFPHPEIADARWIVNVTNDAWFGDTPGPRQHLRHAQVRAVEDGLPVVRAANNGISAVIDPEGRFVGRLALDAVGVIDTGLPAPRSTLYRRLGDAPLFGLILVAAGAGAAAAARRRRGAMKG
ncbi:apolipoprotein N-acyltransferase [Acuticoccus mangrovi]|uniref:Apolipoprotein N-acyltransferase n=1 Tax=Acuticoccus mangrovi TaxID=2796142 RepID=A0A934MH32_9HYPH|nr:apolipoprotein N-acyltransferase [Acuticoccus mangrovi]MBJ3777238.1 apolipoprotein N-acyltransferase [Acuticoccus mangrovi]